jgi:Rad3-related DNA helicase
MLLKNYIIIVLILICYCSAQSQHCPFDGLNIVLIKLNNSSNNMIKFTLNESDNPTVNSCTYSNSLIKKVFQPIDSIYVQKKWVLKYEKKEAVSLKSIGDYYVLLNSAELDCMLKNGNNFDIKKRKFTINSISKKKKKRQIEVNATMIYSLCTSENSWQDIKAISIKN